MQRCTRREGRLRPWNEITQSDPACRAMAWQRLSAPRAWREEIVLSDGGHNGHSLLEGAARASDQRKSYCARVSRAPLDERRKAYATTVHLSSVEVGTVPYKCGTGLNEREKEVLMSVAVPTARQIDVNLS